MRLAAFDSSRIELLAALAGVRHGRDWDRWEWYAHLARTTAGFSAPEGGS
jgi:hypothetical protein